MKTCISFRPGLLASVFLGLILAALFIPSAGLAAPRAPYPPLPELVPVLYRETFNAIYQAGVSNAEVVLPNYGTLRESWSGYALERVGVVPPFVIPGVDEQGRTNVAGANGAVRLWFSPYWSSTTTGEGKGPGAAATLLELVVAEKREAATLWRLQVSEDGSGVTLLGAGGTEPLLTAEIAWHAGTWHQIILNYDAGRGATELVLDGEKVAEGAGVLAVPSRVTQLVIGSSWDGNAAAGGEMDEVFCFKRPLRLAYHYLPFRDIAALGPISEAELVYRQELMAKWQALKAAKAKEAEESGGGMEMLRLVGGTSECITNRPLYITNTVCVLATNQGWTVTFDVQGTNGPADIFTTTNLAGNNITN